MCINVSPVLLLQRAGGERPPPWGACAVRLFLPCVTLHVSCCHAVSACDYSSLSTYVCMCKPSLDLLNCHSTLFWCMCINVSLVLFLQWAGGDHPSPRRPADVSLLICNVHETCIACFMLSCHQCDYVDKYIGNATMQINSVASRHLVYSPLHSSAW